MTQPLDVLFIDDDTALSQLLQKVLTERGFRVDVATDGAAGLAMLRNKRYNVAILDNYLPGMNGIEILREIKKGNLTPRVVMITAVNEADLARESMELGAHAVLPKPFDFEELIRELGTA
jgi:two-component system response regulator (stage 0 sporulation protein F)